MNRNCHPIIQFRNYNFLSMIFFNLRLPAHNLFLDRILIDYKKKNGSKDISPTSIPAKEARSVALESISRFRNCTETGWKIMADEQEFEKCARARACVCGRGTTDVWPRERSESLQRDRSTGYQVPTARSPLLSWRHRSNFPRCAIPVLRRGVERAKISRNADVPRPTRRRNTITLPPWTKNADKSTDKSQLAETNSMLIL